MGSTANYGWPYPEGSDAPQVHLDVKALADDVDTDLAALSTTVSSNDAALRLARVAGCRVWSFSATVPTASRVGVGTLTSFQSVGDVSWATTGTDGVTVGTTGLYAVHVYVAFDGDVGTRSFVELGTGAGGSSTFAREFVNAQEDMGFAAHPCMVLTAADKVTAALYQSSGVSRTATGRLYIAQLRA